MMFLMMIMIVKKMTMKMTMKKFLKATSVSVWAAAETSREEKSAMLAFVVFRPGSTDVSDNYDDDDDDIYISIDLYSWSHYS